MSTNSQIKNTRSSVSHYWIILSVLLLSLFLRSIKLNSTGYWIDEMSSIHFASHPYWGAIFWDNSPGLYNYILKIWIFIFGDHEFATRSLSVVFSVLTTAVWIRFGLIKNGIKGGTALGLIHAVLSFSIYYARETRMYSLFELTSTLILVGAVLIIEERKLSRSVIWCSVVLAILTHYLAVVPIFLALFFLLFFGGEGIKTKYKWDFIIAAIISALALLLIRWPSLEWQKLKYLVEPSSHWPWEVMQQVFGGAIGVCAILIWLVLQIHKNELYAKMLGLAISASMVGASTVTLITKRSLFLDRYFIFLLPLIVLSFLPILDLRFKKINRRNGLLIFFIGLFFSSQVYSYANHLQREKPPWREAAYILSQELNPVVFTTRPLSLGSPYFDRYGIKLIKFNSAENSHFVNIVEMAKSGKNVWLLENFWGSSTYIINFDSFSTSTGCKIKDQSLRNSSAEWVVLIKLDCLASSR